MSASFSSRFKVLNSLLVMDGRPKIDHPLQNYIEAGKDKSGSVRNILRIPHYAREEIYSQQKASLGSRSVSSSSSPSLNLESSLDRGTADGSFTVDEDFTALALESDISRSVNGHVGANHVRGAADGGIEDDEDDDGVDSDFDDFSDDGERVNIIQVVNGVEERKESEVLPPPPPPPVPSGFTGDNEVDEVYYAERKQVLVLGRCKAIYDYEANLYDELSIKTGDVISIHDKQADGWWLGELNGAVGIFPATYVHEVDEDSDDEKVT
jgi:hypothetical protein